MNIFDKPAEKQAILLTVDNQIQAIAPENGTNFTIQELYRLIGCDMVECIDINCEQFVMIGDEEARNKTNAQVNAHATSFYRQMWSIGDPVKAWSAHVQACQEAGAIVIDAWDNEPFDIVGNVVLCHTSMFR